MKRTLLFLCLLVLFLFISKVDSQNLKFKANVHALGLEDGNLPYSFSKISGNPVCELKAKKPDGTVIHTATITINSADVSHNLPASDIGAITDNLIITSTFICTEGILSVSFDLKSEVISKENNDNSNILAVQYFFTLVISNTEESQSTIILQNLWNTPTCNFSITDSTKATIDNSGPVEIEPDSATIIATRVGSSNSALMIATCVVDFAYSGAPNIKTFTTEVPIYFVPGSDPWATASGDPHFKQNVLDSASSSTKSICYDVTGKPGDYLHIAGFPLSDIQVFGKLKDDYYMHGAFIKSSFGNIIVSTSNITLDNQKVLEWHDNSQSTAFQSEHFKYQIFKNQIFISTLNYSSITIRIEKSIHTLAEKHLDVSFKHLPKDYKGMNGLLGDIGKKKYTFYSQVQSEDSIGSKAAVSIGIDQTLVRGTRIDRGDSHCLLINVDDLLKPLKLSSYLHNIN